MSILSSFLWRLKYQIKSLENLIGREEIVHRLKQISSSQDIPHLLFTGPKEFDKMETARLFAKHVLGEAYDTNCKIVYSSDPLTQNERDDTSRNSYIPTRRLGSTAGRRFTWPAFIFSRIKPFVEIRPISFHPLKILIIDDFHFLGNQQQGFRRLMERYSTYCRMILLTDQISSIIDPIISRCNIIFFKQIPYAAFEKKIKEVAKREEINTDENAIKTLYLASKGNVSDSLSYLQTIAVSSSNIDSDAIHDISKDSLQAEVNSLLYNCLSQKEILVKQNVSRIKKFDRTFNDIMALLSEEIFNLPVAEYVKADIINVVSQIDFKTMNSTSTDLMFDYLVQSLIELGIKYE